jgi:hypothetical protein
LINNIISLKKSVALILNVYYKKPVIILAFNLCTSFAFIAILEAEKCSKVNIFFCTKQFNNAEHFEKGFKDSSNNYNEPANIKRITMKYNEKTMKEFFD